jgi:hypothetical protein
MTMAFPGGPDDPVQRALNAAKRAELAEKFGGMFFDGSDPLPPDIESEFLQRIEEFELKWASHAMTTVRTFIGDPPVRDPAELGDDELAEELRQLLETLERNDVEVDFCERPDDREVYRFIVEELLDHEMDDIRVPGMVCHFVYEEFHPNPEYDARFATEWFLERLMTRSELMEPALSRTDVSDALGIPIDFEPLRMEVEDFHTRVASVLDHVLEITSCSVDGADAEATVRIAWTGLECGSMNQVQSRGLARVRLRRSSLDEWEVVGLELPD